MKPKPPFSADAAARRRRAEERLKEQHPEARQTWTEAAIKRLVHELQVHQIELEMQNEELQRTRDKIESELEKFRNLYDFAPVGYLTLDREGSISEVNLPGASLLGLARSRLIKRRFGLFVSAADLPAFNGFLKKVFEGKARESCELSLPKKGKPPVEVRMEATVTASGRECRAVLEDNNERKRAEVTKQRFAAIVHSSEDAIISNTLDGIVTSWNPGAEKMFGYAAEEIIGKTMVMLFPPNRVNEESDLLARIAHGESVKHYETVRVRKDGRAVDVSVTFSPIVDNGRKIVGASKIARDITERKRAEADRLILSKLESTGILAGGIAHDFNNLLTTILLNLELAQALIPSGGDLESCLEEAKRSALMSRGLSQQLITFANGGVSFRKVTSLSQLIQESGRPALSGSRVRCEFSLVDDLWLAEVDEGQIGQVIRNIVLNAREAMPAGGVVSVRAANVVLGSHEGPSLPPGDYVRVSVADRGCGIAKEVLLKIFDPYFSTKQSWNQKGMGLGLTICHSIIQKHGGAIDVESEVGVGTTFHIWLPASRQLIGKEKTSAPKVLPWRGRILLMDDEEAVRKAVEATLRGMGHEIKLAEDGQRAVDVYRSAKELGHPFDAVILDLTVRAGMGGQETIQVLLRMDPTVKAIVMSGHSNDPVVLEHERHGFKGALTKPFDARQLQEILSQVMGS